MDLVDWSEDVFEGIREEFTEFASGLSFEDIVFVPVSALLGDNVVGRSQNTPWYSGPSLLHHLEHVEVAADRNFEDLRFPVQWVIRPHPEERPDYRGYAGQVAGGIVGVGEEVVVLPSGVRTRIAAIDSYDGPFATAYTPMSVTLLLEDDVDVSRGDMICRPADAPEPVRELTADVCWMAEKPLGPGSRYAVKHTTRSARAIVDAIEHKVDVHTLEPGPAATLELNDIGRVQLRFSSPLVADPYARNRQTGSFILIDEATNDTVGAGMIVC
jgi:bifunctional enzyme CysN/CysC